jgi:hypothetical protein
MSRFIRKKYKIFNSIIGFNAVNMMDYFTFFKVSSKMFFHYKSMFSNIVVSFRCIGMVMAQYINISFANIFATVPSRVIMCLKTGAFFSFIPRGLSFFKFGMWRGMPSPKRICDFHSYFFSKRFKFVSFFGRLGHSFSCCLRQCFIVFHNILRSYNNNIKKYSCQGLLEVNR